MHLFAFYPDHPVYGTTWRRLSLVPSTLSRLSTVINAPVEQRRGPPAPRLFATLSKLAFECRRVTLRVTTKGPDWRYYHTSVGKYRRNKEVKCSRTVLSFLALFWKLPGKSKSISLVFQPRPGRRPRGRPGNAAQLQTTPRIQSPISQHLEKGKNANYIVVYAGVALIIYLRLR